MPTSSWSTFIHLTSVAFHPTLPCGTLCFATCEGKRLLDTFTLLLLGSVNFSCRTEKRESRREAKAETAAKLEGAIEAELLKRLQAGTYGDIYNFPAAQYEKALGYAADAKQPAMHYVEDNDQQQSDEEVGSLHNQHACQSITGWRSGQPLCGLLFITVNSTSLAIEGHGSGRRHQRVGGGCACLLRRLDRQFLAFFMMSMCWVSAWHQRVLGGFGMHGQLEVLISADRMQSITAYNGHASQWGYVLLAFHICGVTET